MLSEQVIHVVKDQCVSRNRFDPGRVENEMLVRIREIARGWYQHRDLRRRRFRAHEKHDVIFEFTGAQARGIHAAFQIVGDGPFERRLPATVDDRITVVIDAAVLRRRETEAIIAPVPVVTGHRAHGTVVAMAVHRMRPAVVQRVADPLIRVSDRRVPVAQQAGGRRRRAIPDRRKFRAAEGPGVNARAVDFTVVQTFDLRCTMKTREQQWHIRCGGGQRDGTDAGPGVVTRHDRTDARVVRIDHGFLTQGQLTARRVVGRAHEIPGV